jgi:ATPase subunit of ABC transporter with duplicated ATPase domains
MLFCHINFNLPEGLTALVGDNGVGKPSNHLDSETKQWLAERLLSFKGRCLLISHERMLLNLCRYLAKLTPRGIELVESNYDAFELQNLQHEKATAKKLYQLQVQQNKARFSAQRDTEKAQKRASRGANKGKKGGIPRVLLGAKQHKAESSFSAKIAQHCYLMSLTIILICVVSIYCRMLYFATTVVLF